METIKGKKQESITSARTKEQTRLIGEYSGEAEGPVVIFVGGMHGNEPAAIVALEAVLETLRQLRPPFKGKMVGVRGNLSALSKCQRYIDEDLNRIWCRERMKQLTDNLCDNANETTEQKEQRELFHFLQPYFQNKRRPLYLIDLHTTSARSLPFAVLADTLRNRKLAMKLHAPLVLGLEELFDGTIMHYAGDLGFCTLAFESGQHDDAASIRNHVAAIWLFLAGAGSIARKHIPNFAGHQKRLLNTCKSLPRVFEIKYRYGIQAGEGFRMEPGFENFRPITKGELLAHNNYGDIYSHLSGNIFMPLYQSLGNDGFFIIRKVPYFWLKISEWMRRSRLDKILPLLPGITRNPEATNEFIINQRIARWYVVEIFHLLGYRKKRVEGERLIVTKREYDIRRPERSSSREHV